MSRNINTLVPGTFRSDSLSIEFDLLLDMGVVMDTNFVRLIGIIVVVLFNFNCGDNNYDFDRDLSLAQEGDPYAQYVVAGSLRARE